MVELIAFGGMMRRYVRPLRNFAWVVSILSLVFMFVALGASTPAFATFTTNTQISNGQGFLQGEFAEVGVRGNGAFGSTSVPSGFHQNAGNCLGFRVDRAFDGWDNAASVDDGDFFCPGSPFEGWQMKVGSVAKNDNGQTGVSGSVSDIQSAGSSQCVSWNSSSPYNGVSVEQRYCVPTAGQALHTDVTLTNTTGSAISDVYFGRGFDPDNMTGNGTMTCGGSTITTAMFYSCNAVTGQGAEAQATARWGNGAFIALQSFDARARVARQTGGFSSPDPSDIWSAGDTSSTSGPYLGNVGELGADAGLYVALKVPTLGAGASTSFRISYVLSAEGNNAPVVGAPIVSGIGQTSAHVATTVNPKGYSTIATLVYSTSSSFSSSSSVSMGTLTGTEEVTAEADITGIDPSTTYYAKIVATNETGTTESAVFNFETLAANAPVVTSEEPTVSVDDGPVTLSGTLNPSGFAATAVFQYSTTADFSGTVVDIPVSGTFTGTSVSTVSTVVSDLVGATTYYFRLKVTNASGSAYGSTISFVPADIPAPTSLVVTSLDDTTSSGTLRWAITQANATAGGIYDSITFSVSGTVTLSSALPQITQALTITGNGQTQTIIDGNNLYRPFNVGSGRALTVSDMTLKQGQATNGGLIYNSQGTVIATNIRFTGMTGGSAVFNNNGGSTATYTNCTFDYLNNGIAGDYGSTPQLAAGVTTWAGEPDSVFANKTYVNNSTFSNNNAGIYNYRFTKIQNSTFTNNGYGANVTGLNRTQILNSTFSNNGVAVYHNAWIPTTFNMGTDNRLISGSTFTNNGIAVYLDDGYNNGRKDPRWATITGNTWDEQGTWVLYYLWNGTSNVSGTVGFDESTSLFAQSANVSAAPTTTTTTTTTTTSVPETTSTSTSTTSTTEVPTVSTTPEVIVVPVSPEPETIIPEDTMPATEETLPEETTTEETMPDTPVETLPSEPETETEVIPPDESSVEIEEIQNAIDDLPTDASPDEIAEIIGEALIDATAEEVAEVLSTVFEDATQEEVVAILETVFETATSEEVVAILSETFADGATDEEVAAVTEALLVDGVTEEAVSTLIDVLESGVIDESQVEAVVDAILQEEINDEVATELATSAAVVQNITAEQATDIFESVPVGELTGSEGAAIVDAVQDAPTEVKESFEEEINVFAGVFDEYVAIGSSIDVGTRRSVVAVNLVSTTVAAAASTLAGGSSTGSSVNSSPRQDIAARKEEESEEGGEIAGDGADWISTISIYKIINGRKVMDWMNFFKKLMYTILNTGFTIAGAVVLYFTLSGLTQKIAVWSFILAFIAQTYVAMKEPDTE